MSRRGDCPPPLPSNSTGASSAPPKNGERFDEDFILASLVHIAFQRQADPPDIACQSAATATPSGGAGGPAHAVADSTDGAGRSAGDRVLEPLRGGGHRRDRLL